MSMFGQSITPFITDVVLKKLGEQVEFFLNVKLQPMIKVTQDRYRQDWPAGSERVLDLLTEIHYKASQGEMLKKREREFYLTQIRQKCRKGDRRFTQIEAEEAEENPFVMAVIDLMNRQSRFEGRMVDLLKMLRKTPFAKLGSKQEKISAFTNIFSRRLKRLIPVLRGLGVEVFIEHRESGSHCRLLRKESFEAEPDTAQEKENISLENTDEPVDAPQTFNEPSGVSRATGKDLQTYDGTDEENWFLSQVRNLNSNRDSDSGGNSTDSGTVRRPDD